MLRALRPLRCAVQVLPYRACELCDHGATLAGVRHCRCEGAVRPAPALPVHLVRAPHGACGPDARHLSFPGLHA